MGKFPKYFIRSGLSIFLQNWYGICLPSTVIYGVLQQDNYELAKKLMDAALVRQEAIASNIANIETPGYRRIDLDPNFNHWLENAVRTGDLNHLDPLLTQDKGAATVKPDGNNVELDRELLLLHQINVEHGFLTNFLTGNLRMLRLAITGRNL